MKFKITHIEGSKKGMVEQFDLPAITIGRDPSNTLAFDPIKDDRVSTRHATITEQNGNVVLMDLNARNGTLVNGVKIQGSMPIRPGTLVQFGDGGPMVQVAWEAAAPEPAPAPTPAAAPAPEPKKSGGKGCAILAVLAVIALPCLGGAGYLGYTRYWRAPSGPTLPTIPTDPTQIAREVGRKIDQANQGSGDKPPEKPVEKPATETVESPWKKVGIGTVFEFESQMKMPSMEMKTKMVWTLVDRNDEVAKVKMDTFVQGMDQPTSNTVDMPLKAKATDEQAKPLEEKNETITVPAGTFDCRYYKMVNKAGGVESTSESWTPKDLPVPAKSVTKSGETTTTMTLMKVEKK